MLIFSRSNRLKFEFLKPNIFKFFEIFNPFATERDVLIEEKLPGPILTIRENLLSIFTLCFFIRFNMFETN